MPLDRYLTAYFFPAATHAAATDLIHELLATFYPTLSALMLDAMVRQAEAAEEQEEEGAGGSGNGGSQQQKPGESESCLKKGREGG